MNEKFQVPQADRVVGNFDDFRLDLVSYAENGVVKNKGGEILTEPKQILEMLFHESAAEFYDDFEIKKSERDIEIIELAMKSAKDFARQYGRNEFIEIPLDHVHVFRDGAIEEFSKGRNSHGTGSTLLGELLVERRDDLQTAITAFHELWHILGSYSAVQVTTNGKLKWYRSGFSVLSRDGERTMFKQVDEALTGYMTKKFVEEIIRNRPDFQEVIKEHEVRNPEIDTTRLDELDDLLGFIDDLYENNKNLS